MEKAGVAKLLQASELMEKEGKVVEEAGEYGYKCSHSLEYPGYCVVMDEVGRNINMKGDGHIGREMYLCELGMIPQHKSSRADKHFTLLGLMLLTIELIMCVVIFCKLRPNKKVEMGVDPMIEEAGQFSDHDYTIKNMGKGK